MIFLPSRSAPEILTNELAGFGFSPPPLSFFSFALFSGLPVRESTSYFIHVRLSPTSSSSKDSKPPFFFFSPSPFQVDFLHSAVPECGLLIASPIFSLRAVFRSHFVPHSASKGAQKREKQVEHVWNIVEQQLEHGVTKLLPLPYREKETLETSSIEWKLCSLDYPRQKDLLPYVAFPLPYIPLSTDH